MIAFSQANRSLSLTTPLGKDKLLLNSFSGVESVSEPFHFELDMLSPEQSIDATKIVGKSVTLEVRKGDGTERCFHGIISHFSAGVTRDDFRTYRAEMVPTMWLLTQTANCRVFQNMSADKIIQKVLKDGGVTSIKTSLTGKYAKREYCVQYRESDFDFVSRLMEEEGIFYFFEHSKSDHKLVLADANSAFKPGEEAEVVFEQSGTPQRRASRISKWEHNYRYVAGKWTQTDYNFEDHPARKEKSPARPLTTEAPTTLKLPNQSKYEKFDYPGGYAKKPDGTPLTKTRMQADEAGYHEVHGEGDCVAFVPGSKFKMKDHACKAENGKQYVLTSVRHQGYVGSSYRSIPSVKRTSQDERGSEYSNEFICIPDATTYRPEQKTPRPFIHGSQTAVVVGPAGEEIWPDKHGRVKVQFFWDREGERDQNSSCWVRCAQTSAGKGWGSMSIPRVGQEVIVTYLDGDPDRPLVTGTVYNGDQTPAYKLPDNKTRTYIKTNSSPKGEGFNELRFEDLADKEEIFIHAQKDMVERVLNDKHLVVGQEKDGKKIGHQHSKVFGNVHGHVLGNTVEKVEGNLGLTVGKGDNKDGGALSLNVEKDRAALIEGNDDLHVKKNLACNVDGTNSLTVAKDHSVKTDAGASLDAGKDIANKAGGDFGIQAGKAVGIKAGADAGIEAGANVAIKGGANVVIEASAGITLKVGGNFVTVDASGVSVKGVMVNLNSGGAALAGKPPAPAAPAAPTKAKDAKPPKPEKPLEDTKAATGSKSEPGGLS